MTATDRRGLLPAPRRRGHGEVRRQRVGYTRVRAFTGVPKEGWGWRGSPAVAGDITPGLWGLGLASPWAGEPTEGVGVELGLVDLHMMGRSAPWGLQPPGIGNLGEAVPPSWRGPRCQSIRVKRKDKESIHVYV